MQIREKCFSLSTTTLHKLHLATGLLLFLSATLDKVILTRRSQGKLVEEKTIEFLQCRVYRPFLSEVVRKVRPKSTQPRRTKRL